MNSPDDLWEVHSMNRRTFVGMVTVGAAGTFFQGAPPLLRRCPGSQRRPRARAVRRRVILVRGNCTIAGSGAQCHIRAKPADNPA